MTKKEMEEVIKLHMETIVTLQDAVIDLQKVVVMLADVWRNLKNN